MRELRDGGQGSVFVGEVGGRAAAVKVFRPDHDPRRIERELALLRATTCPHLVQVLDAADVVINGDQHTVIAYELHPGGDLEPLLGPTTTTPTSFADLARIGYEVGAAVDALWVQRIVHRDIKPANIVMAGDGRYVLVDVGFARHVDRSDITAFGLTCGTPGYMSPEHATGRRSLTIHADAFSLGLTLYELAARRHPFNRNQTAIVAGVAPAPLETLRPDLSKPFSRAIDQLLSRTAALRPKALRAFFNPFLGGP